MTFVHPLLLAGLALVGIPVLIHLIMRQQPKHLFFPALRFLLQQQRTNQRKLRLRHLLLLALRILLIAAISLALARPKIFSERLNLTTDRPVAAVMIFDTSPSMEYTVGGRTRLDEAKRRSLELLETLPQGSRVAVLDTVDQGGEWLHSLSQARERIGNLEIRPNNYPVTSQIIPAYELLGKLAETPDLPDEAPRGVLFVFSDRTIACWNANQMDQLQRRRDQLPAPGITALFVDVGVENPASVALTNVEAPNQIIPSNKPVIIRATVKAIGTSCDTEVVCQIGKNEPGERKPVILEAGQSRVFTFERRGLPPGLHQAEITLATKGPLPFANVGYATFTVQGPHQVLVVADDVANARIFKLALETREAFQCEVISLGEARKLFPQELGKYRAICLLGLAKPDFTIWERLEEYVKRGGGLAVIPGDQETDPSSYNLAAAQKLLPGKLIRAVIADEVEKGAVWSAATYQHPVMAPFGEWSKNETVDFLQPDKEPKASGYWEIELPKNQDAYVIVFYGEKKPALIERNLDRKTYRGHVMLFSTPLDDANISGKDSFGNNRPYWNNYLKSSFYLVLVHKTIGYLAGDADSGNFNHPCGQNILIPLPQTPRFPTYMLQGPGLSNAESVVTVNPTQSDLPITKAVMPGNYKVFGADGRAMAAFSMNVAPEESQLDKVPLEKIEALFGPGAVLPIDQKTNFQDAMQNHWNQPLELLPHLMILILLVLIVENLLANKFYRRQPDEESQEPGSKLIHEFSR
jgi:hypothetical protein